MCLIQQKRSLKHGILSMLEYILCVCLGAVVTNIVWYYYHKSACNTQLVEYREKSNADRKAFLKLFTAYNIVCDKNKEYEAELRKYSR